MNQDQIDAEASVRHNARMLRIQKANIAPGASLTLNCYAAVLRHIEEDAGEHTPAELFESLFEEMIRTNPGIPNKRKPCYLRTPQ